MLTRIVGSSHEETAQICGVPVGTIRSRVARARGEHVATIDASEVTGTA